MKDGYRFVDCDMHIIKPTDLFDRYLDPTFRQRVTSSPRPTNSGSTGMRRRPLWFFDGAPISNDGNISQYNRVRGPLVSARANTNVMFAVERGYDAEAQIMGMELEGIDIAVLFPTVGLSSLARDNMDPQLSAAICRAYNDWLHDYCQHSPDQLKMAAILPIHDVDLACQELDRCVRDYAAVGAFVRPNYVNGRYWHSTYWDPLYKPASGSRCPAVLSRRDRIILFDDRASLWREPVHAPRGQPPDRDAARSDRADAGRHLRVLSAAKGGIISSHVPVHISGRILPNYATIDRDDRIDFWRNLIEAVHTEDCKYILQLSMSVDNRTYPVSRTSIGRHRQGASTASR